VGIVANQARLLIGCLAYNLLHMIRDAAFWGESVKPSIDSIIRRLVKVRAGVVYHTSRSVGHLQVASAFSLARYYRILFARACPMAWVERVHHLRGGGVSLKL
jgi:hypothetical protein